MQAQKFYFLLLVALFSCTSKVKEEIQLFHKVQIIDPEIGELHYFEQMVIKEGKLHYLGEKQNWDSYTISEEDTFSGKYLLPPIWDMHSHFAWDAGNDSLLFPLLLSHGILGFEIWEAI